MKAYLKFDLNDQDDKAEFELTLKSSKLQSFIDEWENLMRAKYKYGTEEESILWDTIRGEYYELKNQTIPD